MILCGLAGRNISLASGQKKRFAVRSRFARHEYIKRFKMDLNVQQIALEQLIPYARNARTHSDAQVTQIADSIAEFGFVNPILIGGD
ncbi:hypothetical protein [Bartonella queenslandensis]|uniref:hypothetical protein n=1 Tax=Bartonella queenslandensis TaxID=481138 RepID=UPI001BA87076|nr:hypothetical protein [Bartonella queenslandensis]